MRRFAGVAAAAMLLAGTAAEAQAAPAVQVGLDVVAAEGAGRLAGRKAGLVAHPASVTADGRHAIDVLRAAGIDVVRIFSPERAVRVRGAAWDKVPHNLDGTPWSDRRQSTAQTWADIETKIPIQGLFGEAAWLKAADVRGLDLLVFDLQDAGVRAFTVSGLLVLALDAAGAAGIDFVVLDRPNPLGGERVEGPEGEGWGAGRTALTSVAPGPYRPGVTTGEVARIANARRERPVKLDVVAMKGWRRSMLWPDTGRTWPVPSPNLRTFESAVAYAGTALVEATTASEGRGTDTPLQLVGAPAIDNRRLAALSVPGFVLEAATFTPKRSTGAANPKHSDKECRGVRVSVAQARAAEPYQLGVSLLRALRAQGVPWKSPTALDDLLGTRKVRAALEGGSEVAALLAAVEADEEAFRKERAKSLLY